MTLKPLLFLPLAFAVTPLSGHAAPASPQGASVAQEYDQVRRIALRDSKVQSAVANANDRVNAKILQLDPSLEGFVRQHPRPLEVTETRIVEAPAAPAPAPARVSKPKAPSALAAPAPAPLPVANEKTHVVASGETLGSIASRYGVTTAALQQANHIADARKLSVGQVLRIPGGSGTKRASKPAAKPTHAAHGPHEAQAHAASAKPAAVGASGGSQNKSWWNVF